MSAAPVEGQHNTPTIMLSSFPIFQRRRGTTASSCDHRRRSLVVRCQTLEEQPAQDDIMAWLRISCSGPAAEEPPSELTSPGQHKHDVASEHVKPPPIWTASSDTLHQPLSTRSYHQPCCAPAKRDTTTALGQTTARTAASRCCDAASRICVSHQRRGPAVVHCPVYGCVAGRLFAPFLVCARSTCHSDCAWRLSFRIGHPGGPPTPFNAKPAITR
ncbi:hypothetical protein VTI74DRAFT_11238 [Chaetomium olivicolor]